MTPNQSGHVSWLVDLQLQPGALSAFLQLTQHMVERALSEPGALIYERSISTDATRIIVFERYSGANAAIEHLRSFTLLFGTRFSELVTRRTFIVFGDVTDDLKDLLSPLGATFATSVAGFARAFSADIPAGYPGH